MDTTDTAFLVSFQTSFNESADRASALYREICGFRLYKNRCRAYAIPTAGILTGKGCK